MGNQVRGCESKTRRTRLREYRRLVVLMSLTLVACGGGGGGATTSSSGSGGTSGSSSVKLVSASVNAINAAGLTSTNGYALLDPVSFTLSGSGNYYYELTFIGTAINNATFNVGGSLKANSNNSTISGNGFLGYEIGGTISGTSSGTPLQIVSLDFSQPATLGAGTYHDTLTLRVCQDPACTQQVPGSPLTIPVTETVSGSAAPDAQITVYPSTTVEEPSTQATPASGSITVEGNSLPPTGVYITGGASASGLITGTSFTAPLAANEINNAQGTLTFSLPPPATAGVGIHTDSFPVNACFAPSCTATANGSPWTANVTYVVDPVAGQDFVQQTLNLTVGGLVSDPQNGDLYALSTSSSVLDPNMLVEINPNTATIVSAVTLNGGVGQLQPGTLTISSNDQYLYVAVSDASGTSDQIDRVSTANLGTELTINLPAYTLVSLLAPAPGAPDTVAVLTESNTPQLMIYDNAAPRSGVLTGQNGQNLLAFTWGADATTIFADLGGSSDSLVQVSVGATGPTVARTYSAAALSQTPIVTGGNGMNFVDGLVIWNSGATFDPSTFSLSTSFPVSGAFTSGPAFDTTLNRAYFVSTDQPANETSQMTSIESFNLTTQTALWFARFPAQNPATYLTRWGSDGMAFADNSGGTSSLVIISGNFVAQ